MQGCWLVETARLEEMEHLLWSGTTRPLERKDTLSLVGQGRWIAYVYSSSSSHLLLTRQMYLKELILNLWCHVAFSTCQSHPPTCPAFLPHPTPSRPPQAPQPPLRPNLPNLLLQLLHPPSDLHSQLLRELRGLAIDYPPVHRLRSRLALPSSAGQRASNSRVC